MGVVTGRDHPRRRVESDERPHYGTVRDAAQNSDQRRPPLDGIVPLYLAFWHRTHSGGKYSGRL
ncbi:hypothetical protein [Antrihabitans cavernicola]|uniref:Uncharacterized protein n=1 Tax=Antrihabitans cavernicola TaxID=2495913 RepID=A0A5A7S4Q8_9NOCA|nr:hypothetical protein [Spelaeibacter cavernicola]KAA0017656.1 hypothetical protein FOY51_24745 [Spelaeibacter cavernicola]